MLIDNFKLIFFTCRHCAVVSLFCLCTCLILLVCLQWNIVLSLAPTDYVALPLIVKLSFYEVQYWESATHCIPHRILMQPPPLVRYSASNQPLLSVSTRISWVLLHKLVDRQNVPDVFTFRHIDKFLNVVAVRQQSIDHSIVWIWHLFDRLTLGRFMDWQVSKTNTAGWAWHVTIF